MPQDTPTWADRFVERTHGRVTLCFVQEAFSYVLFGTVGVGVIVAIYTFVSSGKVWDEIGKGGLFDDPDQMKRDQGGSFNPVERDAEVRQMLEARNARRRAAGKDEVNVEDELARLTAPVLDASMMAEIREHVVARNARRVRRGHEPLDVEAEVARQVRELGG
jgi:hypothetical protein